MSFFVTITLSDFQIHLFYNWNRTFLGSEPVAPKLDLSEPQCKAFLPPFSSPTEKQFLCPGPFLCTKTRFLFSLGIFQGFMSFHDGTLFEVRPPRSGDQLYFPVNMGHRVYSQEKLWQRGLTTFLNPVSLLVLWVQWYSGHISCACGGDNV